jgi:pimeloyl-ACP methyl ester carboxylesterase
LNINYVEFGSQGEEGVQETLLLLPTLSDVSTTEEWHAVAEELVGPGKRRAVVVDWPGLGLSDRPALEYTVDLLEKFLVDFVTAANGPLAGAQGLNSSSPMWNLIIQCIMLVCVLSSLLP